MEVHQHQHNRRGADRSSLVYRIARVGGAYGVCAPKAVERVTPFQIEMMEPQAPSVGNDEAKNVGQMNGGLFHGYPIVKSWTGPLVLEGVDLSVGYVLVDFGRKA